MLVFHAAMKCKLKRKIINICVLNESEKFENKEN